MNYFLSLSACLLLFFTSCAPVMTRGLQKGEREIITREQLRPMVDAAGLRKYNMSIDGMKRHFSGLLLVRQTGPEKYRTLFSTHFGLTVFDFEITPEELLVHHCVAPLQKKKLLDLLHKDFAVLFALQLADRNPAIPYTSADSPTIVYRLMDKPAKGFYRKSSAAASPEDIQTGKGLTGRLFTKTADRICIRHKFPRFTIQLEPLP